MSKRIGWRLFSVAMRIVAALLAVALASCSGPRSTVAEITIENGLSFDLEVEVSDRDRQSWLPLATVEAGATVASQEVIDQGELWVFRFRHWGDPVGELSLTRSELAGGGWRVAVPAAVSDRLEELGRPAAE